MRTMSAVEFAGWSHHLVKYPPGDYLTQAILANIWSALVSFLTSTPHEPYQVAPWLSTSAERDARKLAKSTAEAASRAARVAGIYKENKDKIRENSPPHDC